MLKDEANNMVVYYKKKEDALLRARETIDSQSQYQRGVSALLNAMLAETRNLLQQAQHTLTVMCDGSAEQYLSRDYSDVDDDDSDFV